MVVYKYGDPEANIVLIQPVGDHDVHDIENEVSEIMKRTSLEFRMIAVKVDRWNQDLSPWRAPAVFGNEDLARVRRRYWHRYWNCVRMKVRLIILVDIPLRGCLHFGHPAGRTGLPG